MELSSGAWMPSPGFGTWRVTDPAVLREALLSALRAGYRHFDLAPLYRNEAAVGAALAAGMAEVSKDKAFSDKTTSLGIVPTARGPKDFAAFIKSEVETNTALLKEANFKPE